MTEYNLEKLFYDLLKKKNIDKEISYTSSLLTNKNVLAKKIGEDYRFIFSYDPRSKVKRKNPKGILLAFWNAFGFPYDQNKVKKHNNIKLTIKLLNVPRSKNGLENLIK